MNKQSLLFGILPLAVFVIIDFAFDETSGIISAMIFALLEAAYSLYKFKKIDGITAGSIAFVVLFGWLSLETQDPIFFKFQPVILGSCFTVELLVTQAMNKPLLVVIAQKYKDLFPKNIQGNLSHPFVISKLSKLSLFLGFGILIHTLATAYAAVYMSNTWWLAIRGIGLYVVMGLSLILVRFT
ncbi:MAG: septation protein IspZ [Oligoflexales bacterium]